MVMPSALVPHLSQSSLPWHGLQWRALFFSSLTPLSWFSTSLYAFTFDSPICISTWWTCTWEQYIDPLSMSGHGLTNHENCWLYRMFDTQPLNSYNLVEVDTWILKNKQVEKMQTSQKPQVSVNQRNLTQYVASHIGTGICPSLYGTLSLQYKIWPIYYCQEM